MKALFIEYCGQLITVIIAGFGGWFFGRKKQAVEIQGTEIDNGAKAVNLYKEALDDLGLRYEQKYKYVVNLYESREKLLRDEISMLKNKIKMLRVENISFKKRIGELENQLKNEDTNPE